MDDETEFPVIISKLDLGDGTLYIAGCKKDVKPFGEVSGNGYSFEEAKQDWIRNSMNIEISNKTTFSPSPKPIFFFEIDGSEK